MARDENEPVHRRPAVFYRASGSISFAEGYVVRVKKVGGMGEATHTEPARLPIADDRDLLGEGLRTTLTGEAGI